MQYCARGWIDPQKKRVLQMFKEFDQIAAMMTTLQGNLRVVAEISRQIRTCFSEYLWQKKSRESVQKWKLVRDRSRLRNRRLGSLARRGTSVVRRPTCFTPRYGLPGSLRSVGDLFKFLAQDGREVMRRWQSEPENPP